MGKSIGSIIALAGAVIVNVVPGLGQIASAAILIGTAALGAIVAGLNKPKPETAEGSIKSPIPPRVRAYGRSRLFGYYILFETAGNGTAVDVYAIHDGEIDGIERRYLADYSFAFAAPNLVNETPDKAYRDQSVHWYETMGTAIGTAIAAIVSLLPGIWTTNHRGDGVVVVATTWKAAKASRFPETYPQGGPVPISMVARWQRVFDWRDAGQDVADPSTWLWSENAILHLAHYRLVVEKAYRAPGEQLPTGTALQDAWDLFFAPTVEYWTAAADVADEAVPLKAGGSEPRYRSCFSHKMTDRHKDVIAALTSCADAWTAPRSDGALVVYAGKYYAPTVTIGPEHIVSYNWQTGIDDESSINELTLSYISDQHDYAVVECDPWQDLDDISERGAFRSQPLENPVPSNGQARRLAKRVLARLMAPQRGTITTNVAGRIARGERYIHLRIVEAGATFYDGPAEITQMTRNLSTGGVTFTWVAADPNIDVWSAATEEGEPAATGSRYAAEPLDPPTIASAIVAYTGATDEGTGGRIAIEAEGPDRADLVWFARWRIDGAAVWNEQTYTDTDPGTAVDLLTGFVPLNQDIEVEVAYQIGDGRISPWSSPPTIVDTHTDVTVPDAATDITLLGWSDILSLSTTAIPRASSYRWRFYLNDGVTLRRTIYTTVRSVGYTKAQATSDGIAREYIVDVAGVNGAGAGTVFTSGVLTNAAPAAVTGEDGDDDATTGTVNFTPLTGVADFGGYVLYYSTTSGFDPLTAGFTAYTATTPFYVYGLQADTYYAKVAAYDLWTENPALLNFSGETSFTITTGGGGNGGGGGPGGGGGGYVPEG